MKLVRQDTAWNYYGIKGFGWDEESAKPSLFAVTLAKGGLEGEKLGLDNK